MEAFKIEKGIIIPSAYNTKFPFNEMEPGDSFFIPADVLNKVRSAANNFKKSTKNFNFCTRRIDSKGNARLWRIS